MIWKIHTIIVWLLLAGLVWLTWPIPYVLLYCLFNAHCMG